MRRAFAFLVVIQLLGCSPKPQPTDDVFTLTSGVDVVSDALANQNAEISNVRISAEQDFYLVRARAYFYSSGAFDKPWVTLTKNGIATLNLGTSKKVVSHRSESLRDLVIKIDKNRLDSGAVLSVYNLDTSEVMANLAIP